MEELEAISFFNPAAMCLKVFLEVTLLSEGILSNGVSRYQDNVASADIAELKSCVSFRSGRLDGPRLKGVLVIYRNG